MSADTVDTTLADPKEMVARIALLESRVKRVANERNAARAQFARLAKVSDVFANQSSRSLRNWLDSTPDIAVSRFCKAIATTLNDEKSHHLVYHILKTSEQLAIAVDDRKNGRPAEDGKSVEALSATLLRQFNRLHEWDN